MDIKQLEAFALVVENNSFSKTAAQLHLTQPTISAHIASLEKELKLKLIVRTTKEIYPSDAGKLLYEYAKKILDLRAAALQAVENFSREMRGTVTLAASSIPGQYYLPKLLQGFRSRYPDISFNVQMMDSSAVIEAVARRSASAAPWATRSSASMRSLRGIASSSSRPIRRNIRLISQQASRCSRSPTRTSSAVKAAAVPAGRQRPFCGKWA